MENLQVKRVKNKLFEMYEKLIETDNSKNKNPKVKDDSFYSQAIAAYSLIMQTKLSCEESAKYITDGSKDMGIDLIYKDEFSKKLYFIQSKLIKDATSSISQGDTLKFCSGIEKVINCEFEDANEKIKSNQSLIESALNDIDYQIVLIIVYTSNKKISKESENELDKLCKKVNDGNNELIKYTVLYLDDIYQALSTGCNSDINLDNVALQNWGFYCEGESVLRGYYGTVSAITIGEWWSTYKLSLLSKNIRYFKGDTDVNKGIKKVLKEEPENFIYYNNGIKILANKIVRASVNSADKKIGIFNIINASIVNGAQTLGSIGEVYLEDKEKLLYANVFIQIISLENKGEEFGVNITRLSNTQNRIENKDFISINDDFHEKLKQDFALDKIDYVYKTGEVNNSLYEKSCSVDEAVIAHGCFLDDVSISTIVKGGIGRIFDDLTKGPYKRVFNQSVSNYLIWNCIQIYKAFEKENKEYQRKNTGLNKSISIHGNRYLLHRIFQILKKREMFVNVNSEYIQLTEDETQNIQKMIEKSISEIIDIIRNSVFSNAYPANIFKNNQRCSYIDKVISDISQGANTTK